MRDGKKTVQINSFGFPVYIVNCPLIEVDGIWEPDVNYTRLEEALFKALPFKPSKLNGAEIKFIRSHLQMTQAKFAAWLDDVKDASTIAVWERSDLEPTNMETSMEKSLRIQLISYLNKKERRKTIHMNILENITLSVKKTSKKKIEMDSNYLPIPGTALFAEGSYA